MRPVDALGAEFSSGGPQGLFPYQRAVAQSDGQSLKKIMFSLKIKIFLHNNLPVERLKVQLL